MPAAIETGTILCNGSAMGAQTKMGILLCHEIEDQLSILDTAVI